MTKVSITSLLDAGSHFGHQTRRWNPKMKPYIFGSRGDIYIIDLKQTLVGLDQAYTFVSELAKKGGTVLFVGTKKQAQEAVADAANKCGMPYVNARWLGGMLTNFVTIRSRAPGDDLGRAAADVHHEQALPPEVARRAREGEGRLALAGDDGQRDAQARHQRLELVGVARVARGRRGHGPRRDGGMFRRGEPAQHVEEARHGIGHALHGRGLQHARRVHALAEVRDGVLAVELMEPPRLVHVGHEHAARHGADVDGRVSARLETAFGTLGLRDGAHGDPFPRSTRRRTGRPGTASTTSPAPRRCPA